VDSGSKTGRGKHTATGRAAREHDFFAEAIEASMVPSENQIRARDHRQALKLNRMTPTQRVTFMERRKRWEAAYERPAAPLWLTLGLFLVATDLTLAVQLFATRPVIGGVAVVVLIGGSGLILRGFGELRSSKVLKALGYFLGALAYLVVAGVALLNGTRLLLQ
jgi:hypothetical protein